MLLFHFMVRATLFGYWTFYLKVAMVITDMSFETRNGKEPKITIIEFEGTNIMT